jgi:dTDP-4-amino-4,6-dideoxygalactose transaminase
MIGAIPVFVDVKPDSYNIDPELIEDAITEKTRAIMPVHIFGMPADMKHIMDIADSHDLQVIEDACQAHGAEVDGRKVGSLGHVAAFSFYATKNMMTGEGGMITTDNEELYDRCLMVKNHGRGKQGGYSHFRIGYNNRMMDVVAAIGIEQMKRLPEAIKQRRKNAHEFDEFFSEFESIRPQVEDKGLKSAYHLYAPRLYSDIMDRDGIVSALREQGVGSRAVYALPCHKQDTYLNIQQWRWAKFVDYPDYSTVTLPVSEEIGFRHFDIPVHPSLTDSDKQQIKDAFTKILG